MGTWSGFVARVRSDEFDSVVDKLAAEYRTEIKSNKQLCLITGMIKSDTPLADLLNAGVEKARILGGIGDERVDYPDEDQFD